MLFSWFHYCRFLAIRGPNRVLIDMEPLNACVFPCFHAAFVCPPVIHSYRCAAPGLLSTGTSRGAWKLTGGCLDVVAQHLNWMWHHFVLFIDVHCRHRLFPHQNLANPELHNPLIHFQLSLRQHWGNTSGPGHRTISFETWGKSVNSADPIAVGMVEWLEDPRFLYDYASSTQRPTACFFLAIKHHVFNFEIHGHSFFNFCEWIVLDCKVFALKTLVPLDVINIVRVMVSARILERKLRSTKVPSSSIIMFSSEGMKKTYLNLYTPIFFVVL